MPTLAETEDRLRRTFDAVASSVHDFEEPQSNATSIVSEPARQVPLRIRQHRRRNPVWVFAVSFLAVLAVGVFSMLTMGVEPDANVGGAGELQPEPVTTLEPPDASGDVASGDVASADDLGEDPVGTEEELAENGSYAALYQAAVDGYGPSAPPSVMSSLDPGVLELLTADNRILLSASSYEQDGLRFGEAVYGNGDNWIALSWQEWPENVDPGVLYPDDATVETSGTVDVITRQDQHPDTTTASIAVFDGQILAQVRTGNTELDLESVQQIAVQLHGAVS